MPAPRRTTALLVVALLISTGLVAWLAQRQIEVNQAYEKLRRLSSTPHEGYGVPAFLAHTLSGDTLTVGEIADTSARQVLFVLTTTCPYCRATLPVWAGLADSLSHVGGGRVRVLAVSLDSLARTAAFADTQGLRYPVTTFPSEKLRRLYRAGSVPQTIVLDAGGEVIYSHMGKLLAGPVLDSVYRAATGRAAGTPSTAGGPTGATSAQAGSRP